jgi:hypothetical protein
MMAHRKVVLHSGLAQLSRMAYFALKHLMQFTLKAGIKPT